MINFFENWWNVIGIKTKFARKPLAQLAWCAAMANQIEVVDTRIKFHVHRRIRYRINERVPSQLYLEANRCVDTFNKLKGHLFISKKPVVKQLDVNNAHLFVIIENDYHKVKWNPLDKENYIPIKYGQFCEAYKIKGL